MQLIIGNKNYSTWSLRPWLLLTAFQIEFDEKLISLLGDDRSLRLAKFSDSQKVPILVDGDLTVWDTLAICEYISENYLNGKGWPQDKNQRATARSLASEMHSSFANIRNEMPMNVKARRKITLSNAVKMEIKHMDDIWAKCSDGGFLMGDYGIVDCFFTPVASRFKTYRVELSPKAQIYADRLLAHPAMQKWSEAAQLESEILLIDEMGVEV